MALLGPMVVVAETSAADLLHRLGAAGAFPIVEASWADAPAAIAEIQPVALAIAHSAGTPSEKQMRALTHCIEARGGPIMPVLALVDKHSAPAIPDALPVALGQSIDQFISQLRSALRVRTMHATVLRRARAAGPNRQVTVPANLLAGATVLCLGRGGSYPVLSVALGERVGVIGAFSVETAARYLNARDIDGVVIGDGLGPRVVDALVSVLAQDPRFRDLPIGMLNGHAAERDNLPNLIHGAADAIRLVERVLAFVRLQAFENYLKRVLKSLESEGMIDPQTGLLEPHAFWRDLDRAVSEAADAGRALSVARFAFEGVADPRSYLDAARLFSRMVRNIDFACREQDGSILAAFTETDLRNAHVVARRIASVLRETMISPERDRRSIRPTITLATLKASDNLSTLVARVGAYPKATAARA